MKTAFRGGKTPRKVDQYKKLWLELDEFLEVHQHNSPNHRSVYEKFLELAGKQNNNLKRPVDEPMVSQK